MYRTFVLKKLKVISSYLQVSIIQSFCFLWRSAQ